MRILHLSIGIPELRTGGIPRYAYDLAKAESRLGNEVSLLYPGNLEPRHRQPSIRKAAEEEKLQIYKIVNPNYVAVPLGIGNPALITENRKRPDYAGFLDQVRPELVHIHTFMGFHREFFQEIRRRGIPTVYTTHDYYIICPRTSLMDDRGLMCCGPGAEKCAGCNRECTDSRILQYILQSEWYPKVKDCRILSCLKKKRKERYRENKNRADGQSRTKEVKCTEITESVKNAYEKLIRYQQEMLDCVDVIHFTSRLTEEIYEPFTRRQKTFVKNITSGDLTDRRTETVRRTHSVFTIGFIGIRDRHKGAWILQEAGKLLAERQYTFRMIFYGDEFVFDPSAGGFCISGGLFRHEEIDRIMDGMDLMVVPSYWYETFGFVTIEAICCSVPVIVSSHTGSRDILPDDKSVFEPEPQALAEMLMKLMDEPERLQEMIRKQREIRIETDMKVHAAQLMEAIGKATGRMPR